MKRLVDISTKKFISGLSAATPAPGGGSASALVAASGTAVTLMAINYTLKQRVSGRIRRKLIFSKKQNTALTKRLVSLVDEDAAAFKELLASILEKRSTDKLYENAAIVPLEICISCCRAMQLISQIAPYINKNLISDITCGLIFLAAGFDAAAENVMINTKYIKNRELSDKYNKKLTELRRKVLPLRKKIGS